jgi:hypothetical protein
MEQLPESDPVTDAIEKVTHTMHSHPEQGPATQHEAGNQPEGMPGISLAALNSAVNTEARRRYQGHATLTGVSGPLTRFATRLALRLETPYPYALREDDTMFPSDTESFGRVIRRSRQAGLEEIQNTIGEQDKEHNWLFIPDAGLWIDTTLTAQAASVDPDRYIHIFLSHRYPEIENVHTHPDRVVRDVAQTDPWSYSHNFLLEAALPSTDDLIGLRQLAKQTSPHSKQVSSIVSHHGVTSFALTSTPGGDFEGFSTKMYDRKARDDIEPEAAIRELLERMTANVTHYDGTPAVSATFRPLR